MFEAKDIIGDAVKRMKAHVDTLDRGAVIGWGTVEEVSGFAPYSQHWTQFIKRLRGDVLADRRGIKLAAIQSVGLKLMTLTEQLNDVSRQRRARRQLARGMNELRAIPETELTEHQRQAKHRKIHLAHAARRQADYSLRIAHLLAKPTSSGMPRVKLSDIKKPTVTAKTGS